MAVNGGRLFVRSIGEGPPLVVLHGGPDFDHEYPLPEFDDLIGQRRVVLGEHDFVALAIAREIAETIPRSRLEILP